MIKYYCDNCGEEIKTSNNHHLSYYGPKDGVLDDERWRLDIYLGVDIFKIKDVCLSEKKHYCEKCACAILFVISNELRLDRGYGKYATLKNDIDGSIEIGHAGRNNVRFIWE